MEGLKRDPGAGICLREEPHTENYTAVTAAIVLGCVLALVLSAFIFSRFMRKWKWPSLKKILELCGSTNTKNNYLSEPLVAVVSNGVQIMKLIQENKDNLKAWIGVDPSLLLERLKDYDWIPCHVYQSAKNEHGEECVELIVDYFIQKGEPGCERLWDGLYSVRMHYVQLWRWLQKQGATKTRRHDLSEPPVADVANGVQESETMKLIRENKEDLKAWIGVDTSHFLEHLNGYNYIPHHVYKAAKNNHGEECVELILNHFISQGELGCLNLWKALYSVRKHYFQMWRWLQKHGEAVHSIKEKKSDLQLWISRDTQHLLQHLKSQGLIPNELFAEANDMNDGKKCAELLLNYFIQRGNDDCLNLLISLQAVQDEYLEVKQWLDSLGTNKRNRVQGGYESETMKIIRENKDNLKSWMGANPSPLLEHLYDFTLIPPHVYQAAKNKHGEDCVELVLDHFIQQELGCERLWIALYSLRRYYKPLRSWIKQNGESVRSVQEKKSNLKLWISKNPRHLLLQLMSQQRIPNELFTQAKGINDGEKCAELLLNYFIEEGNDDCLQLLFSLQAIQDQYPEVKQWLGSLAFFQRLCKKTSLFLTMYKESVLQEKIQTNTSKLIKALHSDLRPLLYQLQNRNILSNINVRAVKGMEQFQCREKATEYMLELVCMKGRQNIKQFWMALWDLRRTYRQLEDIFEQF
ncbi:uncharacterized protein LOC116937840 [Petromyzon marinus]|uniref:uncharacterized protein LOC116937840 n=1 Tax=Petromyzon marinus TaxID=7757 RepID=UPI003F70EFB2